MLHSYTFATPIPNAFGTGQVETRKTTKVSFFLRASVATYLALVFLSCSRTSGERDSVVLYVDTDTKPDELILEHDLHLSQLTETHTKNLWGIFEDSKGNFYWQDNLIKQVHQYSPDGRYIRSFGREGKGPGELTYMAGSTLWNRTLYLLDSISRSIHLFDLETGRHQTTVDIPIQDSLAVFSRLEKILTESDSTFLLIQSYDSFRFRPDSISLYRFSTEGNLPGSEFFRYPLADAMEGKRGSIRFRSPAEFNAKSEIKTLKSGGFVHSHASEPVFYVYEPDGTLRQSLVLDLEPVPLTDEHIQYEIDNSNPMIDLASSVRNAEEIPEFWPFWNDFKIDPHDNLWVEINTDPPLEREWWVISQNGDWLTKKTLSEEFTKLQHIGMNHIYISRNNDGVMEVDRYRFSFEF